MYAETHLSPDLLQARQTTLAALTKIDDSTLFQLSELTLPEIQSIKEEIAQIFPAGNLPAFVLSGLIQLKGRIINAGQVKQDLTALMRGIGLVPQGLYGLFVAGPAAVLYAYQKMLQLAGKDVSSAFPQGTWQFYLQFGLREDTARHANETVGFQQALAAPPDASMAAAWVCAALELMYSYDELLAADWSERVMLRLIADEASQAGLASRKPFEKLVSDWNRARPYHRPSSSVAYVSHRQEIFQRFAQERLKALPAKARANVQRRYQERQSNELGAYQEQMTILAALEPNRFEERKEPVPLWQAFVAVVWQEHTFLLPACQQDEHSSPLCFPAHSDAPVPLYVLPEAGLCDAERRPLVADRAGRVYYQQNSQWMGNLRPPTAEAVKGWATTILSTASWGDASDLDLQLAAAPRAGQAPLRKELPEASLAELAALRRAPVVINWDGASASLPLAHIRRNRRGIGDHALTIFRTDQSFVFDQSHIFFDGMWGLAVAEILTDGAIHAYRRLVNLAVIPSPAAPLALSAPTETLARISSQVRRNEADAESGAVNIRRLVKLCQMLQQRGARLTVNDVLILCRFVHAVRYAPSRQVREAIQQLQNRSYLHEARAAWESVTATLARYRETNPALLIPMDASNVSPKERIFPTTFRNPLVKIEEQLAEAQQRYADYQAHRTAEAWSAFDRSRRDLLAYLKAFGELLDAVKAVTMRGESFNTATIRLLAHLPATLQHVLDQVPQRIGVLNEIIKGNEVFSNVGRVAPGSSLTRFISAKDDGESKELVWGVMTDDQGRLRVSLRDLRPFVPLLLAMGETGTADLLAQDYVTSYVNTLDELVNGLSDMVAARRR
jgi:hypothetical protein